ncbi:hypothetical protein EDC02_7702 [Micromonospora sp. Llam0]|uniref:hypothetical protein n=1 Tax=Micromonospora sp. Llam0 TaxID=2485143 RepID=UPI000FB8C9E1|nr:hypothetical protein [Micromonospora sp. Llam0]ROO52761.1 hypothetical protein EDC02_7702 [Micromonospora sp. Llam0]
MDEVVTDDRLPGWRARLIHDDSAHEPDGDALAPALLVARRGQPHLATGVYVPAHGVRIVAAFDRLGDRDRFERYLRIHHGTTSLTAVSTPGLDVLIFDTTDFRALVGMTVPADLTAERTEWQAWLDGDVYGVCVERHHTGVTTWDDNTTTAVSQWRVVEDVWGLFGHTSATDYARDLLRECAAG